MKGISTAAAAIALLVAASAVAAHEFKIKDLEFIHPYTREPARGVTDVSVFLVMRNTGARGERIVGVSSPFAARAELRAARADGGGRVAAIEIAANATVEFNADGPHILLLGLTESLEGYQYFPLSLTFERIGQVEIDVYVEEPN
jgi:copper(I)-binding protein